MSVRDPFESSEKKKKNIRRSKTNHKKNKIIGILKKFKRNKKQKKVTFILKPKIFRFDDKNESIVVDNFEIQNKKKCMIF